MTDTKHPEAMLRIVAMRASSGPSLYADRPAICLDVELVPHGAIRAGDVDGLLPFLAGALGQQQDLMASPWAEMNLPNLIGRLALALHWRVLPTADWSAVMPGERPELIRVVFAHSDPLLGAIAGHTAVAWIAAFLSPSVMGSRPTPAPQQAMAKFFADASPYHLGANAKLIIAEAMRRGIPWRRASPDDMTVLLGHGSRLRRLRETLIGGQSKLGSDVATNKHVSNNLLAVAGVPVPRQFQVGDFEGARRAAKVLGYPVVVKPASTDRGTAVHVNIREEAALRPAFLDARRHGLVLVERQIPGFDFRILVLGSRVLAATRRMPASVVGDGQKSIRKLIEQENRNPRRIEGYVPHLLQRIRIDEDLENQLSYQGLDLEAVPRHGAVVRLHGAANLSMGGVPYDVTSEVHPDNRSMFVRAVRILGLEMAGVDFLTQDISRSYKEVGGAICEVNPIPGLRVHIAAPGSPDVISPIVEHLFPSGGDGRIPITAITGTNGKTTTSRMVAAMLRTAGHRVGLATTDNVTIDGVEIARGDLAGVPGAAMVLNDPAVTAAVLETARGGLIRNGLAFDACDVAAVLNVTDDHLGFDGIASRQQMAAAKLTVAKAARKAVVLNADDPLCVGMARSVRAATLWWFARQASNEVVAVHLARGLPAITLAGEGEERRIVVWRDGAAQDLLRLVDIPCTFAGRADFNVANAMAAAAIGFGLGVERDAVIRALSEFAADAAMSLGRCNFVAGWPFRIVIDYAHNPDGVAALCRFLGSEKTGGRRWVVLTSFGNRQEAHFHKVAAAAAKSFDTYICTTDGPRTRTVEEVSTLLAQGLAMAGVDAQNILQAPSEAAAIDRALAEIKPDDLLLVLSSNASATLEHLERLRGRGCSS